MNKKKAKVLRKIIATSNEIRKKIDTIKYDDNEQNRALNEYFKPIVNSLEEIKKNTSSMKTNKKVHVSKVDTNANVKPKLISPSSSKYLNLTAENYDDIENNYKDDADDYKTKKKIH